MKKWTVTFADKWGGDSKVIEVAASDELNAVMLATMQLRNTANWFVLTVTTGGLS